MKHKLFKCVASVIVTFNLLQADTVKQYLNELSHLNKPQQEVMFNTYKKAKEFDLQLTMTAIAWQESKFGKYKLNLNDPSCGVFHVMPSTITKNKWKQSRMCERLIADYDFSFSVALQRLKYFYNYWISKGCNKNTAWKRSIMSYNAGYDYRHGNKYYKQIVKRLKAINIWVNKTYNNNSTFNF